MTKTRKITAKQRDALLDILKDRFDEHIHRHTGVKWDAVLSRIETKDAALASLDAMEESGGEPDVVVLDKASGWSFVDCSAQSPKGRRSVCYDRQALDSRKEHKPKTSALDMAADMGIELLTADEYQALQALEAFDTTTSSWVQTPAKVRKLGGALFCDRRYETVFVYHNGADSYYAARGFRGILRV